MPVRSHLFTCWYASPQAPEDTRRLFDAACVSAELGEGPITEPLQPRLAAIALALAREWSIPDLEQRLVPAIEAQFEPHWDRERGEFTWGLGLAEGHPRGQYNAFLAAAEAMSSGAWSQLSAAPLEACPQVVGVDFPHVALTRARWRDATLHLTLCAHRERPREETRFEIRGAPSGGTWEIAGSAGARIDRSGDALVVTTPLRSGEFRVTQR